MRKLRYGFIALFMLICTANAAVAGVSIGIGLPTVSIGINLPVYPDLVAVPGYPVYYAPGIGGNYFFYDGMYWVYQNDNWYASSWYNGPWGYVDSMSVPLYVLRVPVSFYRQPPAYFRGWQSNEPPRWGEHWGHTWEEHRRGWDHWNRSAAPRPAPLPTYQRQYAGDRYPRVEQQRALRTQQYHYQPRDTVVRQHFKAEAKAPAAQHGKQGNPQARSPQQQNTQHAAPQQRGPATHEQRQQPAAQRQQQQHQQQQKQQKQQQQKQQQQQQQQRQQQQRQQPAAQRQQQQQQQQQRQQQQQQQRQQQQQPQRQQQQQPQRQQQQRQQPAAQPQQQQGHEQRGGGQEHGQGQNREAGRGR